MPALDIQHAIALLEQGKPGEAIPLLQRLTDAMPVYTTAYVLLARAYEAEHRWHEALEAWQRAHYLMPNSPSVQEGIARVGDRAVATPRPSAMPPSAAAPAAGGDAGDAAVDPAVPSPPEGGAGPEAPTAPGDTGVGDAPAAPEPPAAAPEPPAAAPDPSAAAPEPPAADPGELPAAPAEGPEAGPAHEGEADEADEADEAERLPPAEAVRRRMERLPDASDAEDLDRLISELESARIVPRPDIDDLPAPDLEDDVDDMVSETLARIYASQRQFDEAARVYELLAAQQPGRADEFLRKADEMRAQATDR